MDNIKLLTHNLSPTPKMPVLFVAHGNPMNVIFDNEITQNWKKIGENFPQAKAIVVISAHWLSKGTLVSSALSQDLIYDFYGFPQEMYDVKYDVKGNPEVAEAIKNYLNYETFLDSNRGLDHGTWTILKHLSPEEKIPVLQISLNMNQSLEELMDFFKSLKPLRDQGIIFIGSGNIIHNLKMINPYLEQNSGWALEFDDKIKMPILNKDKKILTNPYDLGTSAKLAIPTDEHYRPMLAALALIEKDEELQYFNENIFDMGSIGMRSFITK